MTADELTDWACDLDAVAEAMEKVKDSRLVHIATLVREAEFECNQLADHVPS